MITLDDLLSRFGLRDQRKSALKSGGTNQGSSSAKNPYTDIYVFEVSNDSTQYGSDSDILFSIMFIEITTSWPPVMLVTFLAEGQILCLTKQVTWN